MTTEWSTDVCAICDDPIVEGQPTVTSPVGAVAHDRCVQILKQERALTEPLCKNESGLPGTGFCTREADHGGRWHRDPFGNAWLRTSL